MVAGVIGFTAISIVFAIVFIILKNRKTRADEHRKESEEQVNAFLIAEKERILNEARKYTDEKKLEYIKSRMEFARDDEMINNLINEGKLDEAFYIVTVAFECFIA